MAPPPMNRQQLLDRCDLAGIAMVAPFRKSEPGEGFAKLAFFELRKGSVRDAAGRPAPFAYVALRPGHDAQSRVPPVLGGWSDEDRFEVGDTVLVYLNWSESRQAYVTTWINAVLPARAPEIPWRPEAKAA